MSPRPSQLHSGSLERFRSFLETEPANDFLVSSISFPCPLRWLLHLPCYVQRRRPTCHFTLYIRNSDRFADLSGRCLRTVCGRVLLDGRQQTSRGRETETTV